MKQSFALAAFAGVALAGPDGGNSAFGLGNKLDNDPAFANFASKYNKDIRDAATYAKKLARFHTNQGIVNDVNRKADESGDPLALRLDINWTADLEPEEYAKLLGLKEKNGTAVSMEPTECQKGNCNGNNGNGRGLAYTATNVDHAASGFMSPIKNQGGCGSCWAFAATTTLEGTLAKKTNTAPRRYSEQLLVDCTLTNNTYNMSLFGKDYGMYGCDGGWTDTAWDFMIDRGAMNNVDYPYTSGSTGVETKCAYNSAKVAGKAKNWGQITTNTDDVKAKLMTQPLAVALDASSSVFQLYKSGVVTDTSGCGTTLNHAVVIVGYTDSGAPTPPPPTPTPTTGCTVNKWWHSCTTASSGRLLADAGGNDKYWKVQNSWGTSWGDQGFILIGISSGVGACGINSYIEWVEHL